MQTANPTAADPNLANLPQTSHADTQTPQIPLIMMTYIVSLLTPPRMDCSGLCDKPLLVCMHSTRYNNILGLCAGKYNNIDGRQRL